MSLSRALDPSLSPPEGVHVSAKGKVLLIDNNGNEFEIIKIASATFNMNNSIGLYMETGKQHGTTFAGLFSGRGSIRRALLNMSGIRLVMNGEYRVSDDLLSLLEKTVIYSDRNNTGILEIKRYPITNLFIDAIITTAFDPSDGSAGSRWEYSYRFHKVLFKSERVVWDSNDLIRSGPLDFIYSYPSVLADGTVSETA